MNHERVTSHNWRTNRKIDKQAKNRGIFLDLSHQNCDERMEMVKRRRETLISNVIPGNLPSSVTLKNPVAAERTQKNLICWLSQRTYERKVALWFGLFFWFLSFSKMLKLECKNGCHWSVTATRNSDLFCDYRQTKCSPLGATAHVHALAQPTVQFHCLPPASTAIQKKKFSHDELYKSSTDDSEALIET